MGPFKNCGKITGTGWSTMLLLKMYRDAHQTKQNVKTILAFVTEYSRFKFEKCGSECNVTFRWVLELL